MIFLVEILTLVNFQLTIETSLCSLRQAQGTLQNKTNKILTFVLAVCTRAQLNMLHHT